MRKVAGERANATEDLGGVRVTIHREHELLPQLLFPHGVGIQAFVGSLGMLKCDLQSRDIIVRCKGLLRDSSASAIPH
ncbi:hypothetical protein PMIN01_07847 [Paraphaeosphaeria minitans]|uniref:Uncharacterized protein n=1 Tax=Paraphaeosphaeria minitans TaxID=565426 RepID=A0A9P6GG28_9PLEO|nr:hypothetical protein PMIN01_07847 [Paraphaeosphaeria minitans]